MQKKNIFFQKNFAVSKKSSTFAVDFMMKPEVLSSSGLGQRPLTP